MKTLFGVALLSILMGNSPTFCQSVQKEPDGVIITAPDEVSGIKELRIKVWDDNIIRIISSPTNEFSSRESPIITREGKITSTNMESIGDHEPDEFVDKLHHGEN